MIPYGHQDITQSDIEAVEKILRSDFLTQGPAVENFENAMASRVGVRHAVAVNSATSALHIACLALDLGPRDILWTVPNTFVASANCARYCGAEVDFVDIDPVTWNLSVAALTVKLAEAKRRGRLPKVVVPVHFAGQPTEQQAIWELAREYGFKVLEDASHAVGASRDGEPVGSCRWSHVTVFSFHPVKIITSGEGGMALTNDEALARHMRMFRSHGITRDGGCFRGGIEGVENASSSVQQPPPWHYEQQMLGYNYRITDIQAALGSSQLERLDAYLERRNNLARRYDRDLSGLPVQLPRVLPENKSAFHLYVVRTVHGGDVRRRAFAKLRQRGIGVNVHYMPVHLQPYYRELGFAAGQYPEAEAHGRTALTLPLYPAMTDQEQQEVVIALKQAF